MKVSVKNLPKSQVELTIELSVEYLKPFIEQAVVEISKEVNISGFRPGKAPYDILEKQVGALRIYQHAAENAVKDTYPKAVMDNKLIVIGSPNISVEKIAPNNPLIYKAVAALLPKAELGNYNELNIVKKDIKVEEKDVEGAVTNLQKMMGKEKRVTRQIQKGDKTEIDMETFVDKVPIDGGASKNQPVKIGEGHFIPGFEDGLIGLAEGQSKEFELKFPKEYHQKHLAGKPVEFKVKVNAVFEIELPPLDDNFAVMAGKFEKLDDLRKQLEKNIYEEKRAKEHQRWELAIIDKIISISKFDEIPDTLIESELHKMMHELENEVVGQGMKFDDYLSNIKKTKEELKIEFKPRAEKRVKTALLLRNIANKEKITVSDDEVSKEIEQNKIQYKDNADILKQIESEPYKDYLKNIMRSRKVFEYLEKKDK